MIQTNSYILADTHITLCFDDGFHTTIYNTDQNFDKVRASVCANDWLTARHAVDPANVVTKAIDSVATTKVRIAAGVVWYEDTAIHTTLTKRILTMLDEGFDIAPMILFFENLMSNSSYRAVTELYDFLEVGQLPITADGHFLAYKRVNSDYTDCHTGTIDNSVGCVVKMERNQVDEDKDSTCSTGLHFCSRQYLRLFSGDRTMVVKINPRDVVSIPSDYNNTKGRCCQYQVIQELDSENPAKLEGAFDDNTDMSCVRQLDMDGNVVDQHASVEDAARATGINKSYIARVLRGERQSTGGYKWDFLIRTTPVEGISFTITL